jgi:hypothetical protein
MCLMYRGRADYTQRKCDSFCFFWFLACSRASKLRVSILQLLSNCAAVFVLLIVVFLCSVDQLYTKIVAMSVIECATHTSRSDNFSVSLYIVSCIVQQ